MVMTLTKGHSWWSSMWIFRHTLIGMVLVVVPGQLTQLDDEHFVAAFLPADHWPS